MQHYVIKIVSDLRAIGRRFSPGTPVFSTINLTTLIELKYR